MPIKNINLMQQKDDIFFKKSSDQYIQSLANLGQRIGIKGDSPKSGSFTFNDIYKYMFGQSDKISDDFIGYIKYDNTVDSLNIKNGVLGVINKEELVNHNFLLKNVSIDDKHQRKSIDNIFNNYTLQEKTNFLLNLNISDFGEYLENSIIKVKDNIMYAILFVRSLNTNAGKILLYYQFDIINNKLLYNLRLEYFAGDNNISDTLVLLELDDRYLHDSLKQKKYYSLYKVNKNDLQTLYKHNSKNILLENEIFRNIVDFLTTDEFSSNNYIKLFDEIDISNIDEILDPNSIFGYFFAKDSIGQLLNLYGQIELTYDDNITNGYQYIIDTNNYSESINNFNKILNQLHNSNNTDNTDILTNYIQDINNQKNDLLPKIFEYYNNRFYFDSIYNFYLRILQNIYEDCINILIKEDTLEEKIETLDYEKYNCILYIPVDLEIKYIYNSNNSFEIFYSNDIFINEKNLVLKPIVIEQLNNIIFSSDEITQEKTRVVDFSIDFNKYSNNILINKVNINQKYTLPFIDIDTNNWIINGENSGLSSYIDNYIDQNIIIIYTKSQGNGVYLTNLNKNIKDKINQTVFDDKIFYLNPYQLTINNIDINENISSNLMCHAALPHINGNNFDYFESTLVFCIVSNDCIDENENIKLNNFQLCTLWKMVDNEWTIINNVDNQFLNLSDLFNGHLAMNREFNFKNYIYDYIGLLLDQHYYLNELQSENNLFLLYPEKQIPGEDNNYEVNPNTLSIMLKFITNQISINNNILSKYTSDVKSENYIGNLNSLDKYISLGNSGQVSSNELYEDPYYRNVYTVSSQSSESEDTTTDFNATENESSYDTTVEQTSNGVTTESVSKYNVEYGDFIFNKNCPTLNLAETLLNNVTLINRLNFIIPNKTSNSSKLYGAFIGSELDKSKKNIFSIRSSNRIHNLGTQTLIDEDDKNKFEEQDKLLIKFKEIEMNGDNIYASSLFDKRIYLNKAKTTYKDYNTFILSGFINNDMVNSINGNNDRQPLFRDEDENYSVRLVTQNDISSPSLTLNNNALIVNISISEMTGDLIVVDKCIREEKTYLIIDLVKYLKSNYGEIDLFSTINNDHFFQSFSKDLDMFLIYVENTSVNYNYPWLAINKDLVDIQTIDSATGIHIFTFNKEITLSRYIIDETQKYIAISC